MHRPLSLRTLFLLGTLALTAPAAVAGGKSKTNLRVGGEREREKQNWWPGMEQGGIEGEGTTVVDVPLRKEMIDIMDQVVVQGGVQPKDDIIDIPRQYTLGGERPAFAVVPDAYDEKANKQWPLIMMLHGYGSDAHYHDHFLGVSERVNSHQFIALLPNGTTNSQGRHFWNGLRCCDFDHQGPDDIAYLTGLLEEAIETMHVNPKRVYMIGHSNGGAMTQILACTHADYFAAIASVTPGEIPSPCTPSHPLSVLEVCASEDPIVKIDLCSNIIGNWTMNDGCPKEATFKETRDYDCDPTKPYDDNDGYDQWRDHNCKLQGNETEVTGYTCKKHTQVEFWWMKGAVHNPAFSPQWSEDVISWLLSKKYVEA